MLSQDTANLPHNVWRIKEQHLFYAYMGQERTRKNRVKILHAPKKTFFKMSSVQWAVFPHDLAWERSAKHSMSSLAEFKSSPHNLIFTSVKRDQPWWSQCFSICSFVVLGGFSRTLLRDNPACGFPPALRKGAEVTFSAASSLLPCNSQGERDICADLVEEKS